MEGLDDSTNDPGDGMELTYEEAATLLYKESELLDGWRLEEWASLFTDDASYLVPPLDNPNDNPANTLFLIYDDRHRLEQRALRLLKASAHAEFPRSRLRRIVSNIRITNEGDEFVRVESNFVVYRSRGTAFDIFPGHAEYDIVRLPGKGLAFRKKRAILDLDTLRPHGKLSIIL